jgi:hypothetical protein
MRTKLQAMSDRLLLLYAIAEGNKAGKVDGTFKLMKIPFMAELASTRRSINTFHYSFFRWTFGPFTTEIYEDADSLTSLGLCTPKESPSITAKGETVLESAYELFQQNRDSLWFVKQASKECSPLGFGALKNLVYKEMVTVDGVPRTIADTPKGRQVLSTCSKPKDSFVLDDDWTDSLWCYFNYSDDDLSAMSIIRPATSFEIAIQ